MWYCVAGVGEPFPLQKVEPQVAFSLLGNHGTLIISDTFILPAEDAE